MTDSKAWLRPLGPLTAEVMETLWAAGEPLTPRAVLDSLNSHRRKPLAYTTVVTVLSRLAERDVLRRTPAGRGYAYEPAVGDAAALAVREVIRQHGEAAIAPFLRETRADAHLRARFERLLSEDQPPD
jgi:predicted transcriptional regulator